MESAALSLLFCVWATSAITVDDVRNLDFIGQLYRVSPPATVVDCDLHGWVTTSARSNFTPQYRTVWSSTADYSSDAAVVQVKSQYVYEVETGFTHTW